MKDYKYDLVWKLIDQQITESEMAELEVLFEQEPDLRHYYQSCLETEGCLASYASTQPQEAGGSSLSRSLRLSMLSLAAGAVAVMSIGAWIGSFFATTPETAALSATP